MTTFSFYPGDEDQDPKKTDPTDDPLVDDPAEEETEEKESTPDADEDDLLDGDDGIVEGEEIE